MRGIQKLRAIATLAATWAVAWGVVGLVVGFISWSARAARYADGLQLNFPILSNSIGAALFSGAIGALAGICFGSVVLTSEARGTGALNHPVRASLMTGFSLAIVYCAVLQLVASLFNPWLFPLYQLLQGAIVFGGLSAASAGMTLAMARNRGLQSVIATEAPMELGSTPSWEEAGAWHEALDIQQDRVDST